MDDQRLPVRQAVSAHPVGDTRRQDLLRPPPPDPQQELHRRPIHERPRLPLELVDYFLDFAAPGWFCRHKGSLLR